MTVFLIDDLIYSLATLSPTNCAQSVIRALAFLQLMLMELAFITSSFIVPKQHIVKKKV
jgi:hypothetical protein